MIKMETFQGKHLICLLLLTLFFVFFYVYVQNRYNITLIKNMVIEQEANENGDLYRNQSEKLTNILRIDYEKISTVNLDKFQFIGPKELKAKVFSAYYDDRIDALGKQATTSFYEIIQLNNEELLGPVKSGKINEQQIQWLARVLAILPLNTSVQNIFCHFIYENNTVSVINPSNFKTIRKTKFVDSILECPVFSLNDRPFAVGISYKNKNVLTNAVKIKVSFNEFKRYKKYKLI